MHGNLAFDTCVHLMLFQFIISTSSQNYTYFLLDFSGGGGEILSLTLRIFFLLFFLLLIQFLFYPSYSTPLFYSSREKALSFCLHATIYFSFLIRKKAENFSSWCTEKDDFLAILLCVDWKQQGGPIVWWKEATLKIILFFEFECTVHYALCQRS